MNIQWVHFVTVLLVVSDITATDHKMHLLLVNEKCF